MNFVPDITGRFLINIEKIDYVDYKPDGSWWVVVGSRPFEVTEEIAKKLAKKEEENESI